MILLRPNTTTMTMLFVALNGMISVLALPVSNENDHSHGVQSQAQGPRKTLLNSRSDSPDQRSPMDQWDGLASAALLHPSTGIYLGPGDSGIWPPTGYPRKLPPVAIPPSFPPTSVGAQVELYKRMEGVNGHEVLSFGEKLDRLKDFDWFWSSIDPTTRQDELRNSGTVCAKLERKKLVNAYLILLYKLTDVVAQIRWIKQTSTYRHMNEVKSTCDESIKRVEESIRTVEKAKGVSQSASPGQQWLVLEPDDMIVLGLADPRRQFDGANYLIQPYQRQQVHPTRWLEETPDERRESGGQPWQELN
ncbi:hypothetical protein FB446DRAFT_793915 [Lentinula raphanica]|nr:hypothetical protein FB446DRAFT_793915 [Lentinula raphanica]